MAQSIFEFNGADGASITSLLTDISSGTASGVIQNNSVTSSEVDPIGGGVAFYVRDTGIADFDITAVMSASGPYNSRIIYRAIDDTSYNTVTLKGDGTLEVKTQDSGVAGTIVGNFPVSNEVAGYVVGDWLIVNVTATGNQLTLRLNGNFVGNYSTFLNQSATSHGIRIAGNQSFIDSLFMEDNNPVTDVNVNTPPTANAGADQTNISAGSTVTLDATGTTAGDGTITGYQWTQTAGTTVSITNANTATATFTAPSTGADQTLTFQVEVTDSNGETSTDTVDIGVLAQTIVVSGMKRQITKLGKLLDRPSTMTFEEEFWQKVYPTDNFVNWDSDKYPLIMYSSTDHDTGSGGIWVRVYEKSLGAVTDGTAWVEWDTVANRAEFSHITQKTNPIVTGNQRETPTLLEHDGTLYLYVHDNTSSLEGFPQASFYLTGTNGIDFNNATLASFSQSQRFNTGDGHTGYALVGLNTFTEHNYKFIGRALQGGGDEVRNNGLQIIASNDAVNWDKLNYHRRINSDLVPFNRVGEGDHVYPFDIMYDARKEGAYYRILSAYSPPSSGGFVNPRKLVELLVNSDFTPVSEPSMLVDLGGAGEFDAREILTPDFFTYENKQYLTYKTTQADDTSAIGIATVEEVPHDWNIIYPYSSESLVAESATTDVAVAPNFTYSQTATRKTENGKELTSLPILLDQTLSTAVYNSTIDLTANDMTIIRFKDIGKDSTGKIALSFGITDDIASPTNELTIAFQAQSNTEPDNQIRIRRVGTNTTTNVDVNQRSGNNDTFLGTDRESPYAKHDLALRIIPVENLLTIMTGSTPIANIDITGLDYTANFAPFLKSRFTENNATDETISFGAMEVYSYSLNEIPVIDAPTAIATQTSTSITVTASTVAGAIGYKYYLNDIEQDTGVFTGLEPETEYRVYARAVDANTVSAPSNILSVTTQAQADTTPPVITINGTNPVIVTQGDTYTDAGATALDAVDGVVSVTTTSNNVDTSTIANGYEVVYSATDAAGNTATATRVVNVVAPADVTAPVITLLGDNPVTITQDTIYTDAGATATDDIDGDITANIVTVNPVTTSTIGQYTVTYNVADSAGNNATEVTRTVNVVAAPDTTKPVVNLVPSTLVYNLTVGDTFTLPTSTLTDDTDNTRTITPTSNNVDTSTAGSYSVVYSGYEDAAGNIADTVTITVNVADLPSNILQTSEFSLVTDNILMSFKDRSNIEVMQFKVPNEIANELGLFDFTASNVTKVEVTTAINSTSGSTIDSDTNAVSFEDDKLFVELGALTGIGVQSMAVIIYTAEDSKGLVICGPGLNDSNAVVTFIN